MHAARPNARLYELHELHALSRNPSRERFAWFFGFVTGTRASIHWLNALDALNADPAVENQKGGESPERGTQMHGV
ncbi:hypothetical protein HK102_003258 [Quaeritorhiza haematococci]|nr:hypothetical protein HK102_003258 [Quaeritorhiza haematococci]